MKEWILIIAAGTATEPPIEVARYAREDDCIAAQRTLLKALAETLESAKTDRDGLVLGPGVDCKKR